MFKPVLQTFSNGSKRSKLQVDTSTDCNPSGASNASDLQRNRHGLWTDKYSPISFEDLVGNSSSISTLRSWLKSWQLDTKADSKGSFRKAVLLSGPPGIGKTTSAILACKELGLRVLSVNASDTRGKCSIVGDGVAGLLASKIKEFVTNKNFGDGLTSAYVNSALIMDEVDGMSAGERGGISELIDTIKMTRVPIICICNDRYSQKLKSLLNYCLDVPFQRPNRISVRKRLMSIAQLEGLEIDSDTLDSLIELNNNDLRSSINQMQLWSMSNKYGIQKQLSKKDVSTNAFQAVDALFRSPSESLDTLTNLVFQHADMLPLFVQENYVQMRPIQCKGELHRLELSAAAASRISEADIFETCVNRSQMWSLMTPGNIMACILPSATVRGVRESWIQGERNFHRFPNILGKIAKKRKAERTINEVHRSIRSSGSSTITANELILNTAYLMKRYLTAPLFSKQKGGGEGEGISKVVSFMRDYNLSKDDWTNLQDFTALAGKGPIFDAPSVSIPTSVKSAFTRACKRRNINE